MAAASGLTGESSLDARLTALSRYDVHDGLPSNWGVAYRRRSPAGCCLGERLWDRTLTNAGWNMPVSNSLTLSGRIRLPPLTLRVLPVATASRLATSIMVVLMSGVASAVATTTDHMWWQLHFSRLGEFHNGSGLLFNGTLISAGVLIVVFARRVRADVRSLARARRGSARTTSVLISCVGVSLAMVGMVPLNSNSFLHDRAASGIVLSFAALLLTSTWFLHKAVRGLSLANVGALIVLFVAATFFVSGTINLALFEALGFTTIFGWVGVFTRCLTASVRVDSKRAVTTAQTGETAPVAQRTVRSRPLRTHAVSGPSVARSASARPRRLAARRRTSWARNLQAAHEYPPTRRVIVERGLRSVRPVRIARTARRLDRPMDVTPQGAPSGSHPIRR